MKPFGRIAIRSVSLFFSEEATKIYAFFIVRDLRQPAPISVFYPRQSTHPFEAMFVNGPGVCSVLPVSGLPQIIKSVVFSIAVNVIDLLSRHRASHIKPDEPMSRVMLPVNLNVNIAGAMNSASNLPNSYLRSGGCPEEISSFGIVAENSGKFCVSKHRENLPGRSGKRK